MSVTLSLERLQGRDDSGRVQGQTYSLYYKLDCTNANTRKDAEHAQQYKQVQRRGHNTDLQTHDVHTRREANTLTSFRSCGAAPQSFELFLAF